MTMGTVQINIVIHARSVQSFRNQASDYLRMLSFGGYADVVRGCIDSVQWAEDNRTIVLQWVRID